MFFLIEGRMSIDEYGIDLLYGEGGLILRLPGLCWRLLRATGLGVVSSSPAYFSA